VKEGGLSTDFWKFWGGQTISNLGSSFTQWAVPLLVYRLTHSALSLGVATAATFLPYLLFGLLIGAWMDRVDRKRAMIALDVLNAIVILSIPLVSMSGTPERLVDLRRHLHPVDRLHRLQRGRVRSNSESRFD